MYDWHLDNVQFGTQVAVLFSDLRRSPVFIKDPNFHLMMASPFSEDDKLELAARLLRVIGETDRTLVLGTLCGRISTSDSCHRCRDRVPLHSEENGECATSSSANECCSYSEVSHENKEGTVKDELEPLNVPNEEHNEVALMEVDSEDRDENSVVMLWRSFLDSTLLSLFQHENSAAFATINEFRPSGRSITSGERRPYQLDNFSLSYLSAQRIASAIADATILLEETANSTKTTGASSFTDSSKILSYILQLSAAESKLKSALSEDACLKLKRRSTVYTNELENLGMIEDDRTRGIHFDSLNFLGCMDDLVESKKIKERKKDPFFVLTMESFRSSFGSALEDFFQALPPDIAPEDLFCLCINLNDFTCSAVPCKRPLFNQ